MSHVGNLHQLTGRFQLGNGFALESVVFKCHRNPEHGALANFSGAGGPTDGLWRSRNSHQTGFGLQSEGP